VGRGFASAADARRISRAIRDVLTPEDREARRKALLLIGKSAGGIALWNALRLRYEEITGGFKRCALVLIDPHGTAFRDDRGSYGHGEDLYRPASWPTDQSEFRVYNIFQQQYPGAGGGLTGASFPRARYNQRLFDTVSREEGGLHHMNILERTEVHNMIRIGYEFARTGEDNPWALCRARAS
jgi:hypothetical protein